MKWVEKRRRPKTGGTRIIERFLFFPLTIGKETRWLERVRILERYDAYPLILYPEYVSHWESVKFVDKPKPIKVRGVIGEKRIFNQN